MAASSEQYGKSGSPPADRLTIRELDRDDLIWIVGFGFWTPEIIKSHFEEFRSLVRARREAGRIIRTVVDLRQAGVQSKETTDIMKASVASIHEAGDRVAIVLHSSLARMQMRRVLVSAHHEFFLSEEEAVRWVVGGS
jgi:hypothetical protein